MSDLIETSRRQQPPRRQRAISRRQGYNEERSRGAFPPHFTVLLLALLVVISLFPGVSSFGSIQPTSSQLLLLLSRREVATSNDLSKGSGLKASRTGEDDHFMDSDYYRNRSTSESTRREIFSRAVASAGCLLATTIAVPSLAVASSAEDDVKEMRSLIEQASKQLETVPSLVQEEKWDGVRKVLMEAPLRDCWSKSTPILKKYAEALGETPKGDELAALEGREDLLQHLRFLDMAVYNNVFNPIATEGKTGASKALVDSYYNDPTREYEASKKAIESLIELSN